VRQCAREKRMKRTQRFPFEGNVEGNIEAVPALTSRGRMKGLLPHDRTGGIPHHGSGEEIEPGALRRAGASPLAFSFTSCPFLS
jgi:hypothetical protein